MASIHPTSSTAPATTPASNDGNFPFLPPSPPAPAPPDGNEESPRDKLWTVQETLHLLYLLSLARNDDPIIPPEQWSSCLHLLSSQMTEALEEDSEEAVCA
jgi:hypothetical protein